MTEPRPGPPSSNAEDWSSDQHAVDIQQLAFDLDEALAEVLHGATVRFERFNAGYWVAYLVPFDDPTEYAGSSTTVESALLAAVFVYLRQQRDRQAVTAGKDTGGS